MTFTIYEGYDKSYVLIGTKNALWGDEFRRTFGSVYKVPVSDIYRELAQISSWCNNKIGEECLFEVD